MRVQLSEKSKAEFIELINKDSITCWFEGDEFVMPSGQGKTAKVIVLGKLLVWQHQQSKVDELQKRVDAAIELCGRCGVLGAPLAVRIEQALNGGGESKPADKNKPA